MANVTPIQQPVLEDLKNALTIASLGYDGYLGGDSRYDEVGSGFGDIVRLLRHAIEGLSEPNLAAMQAGEILLKEWHGTPEPERQLRDTLAGILRAQLTGQVPPTWERE